MGTVDSVGTIEERFKAYILDTGKNYSDVGKSFKRARTKQAVSAKLKKHGRMNENEMYEYADALGLEIHISIREKDSLKEY